MFTGIIEELGTVLECGSRLRVGCKTVLSDLTIGASIAVNGVCLTAVDVAEDSFAADLAPETLKRSNLGDLRASSRVNLERPVTPATRLSGHIVQGHVDATGELVSMANGWLKVRISREFGRYLIEKGSITIDGISLTVAAIEPGPIVGVAIIPHTYHATTLGFSTPGDRLNIEVDMIAKYIEKLMRGTIDANGEAG
jgi:riboflavin synthase